MNHKIVVELKTVDYFTDGNIVQTLTFMRLGGFHLGLLINFKIKSLKEGIKRLIL